MKTIISLFTYKIIVYISTILLVFGYSINIAYAESGHFCGDPLPAESQQLESIIPALYNVVSGAAGEPKDWQLMADLFAPTSQIIPVFHDEEGQPQIQALTVDEFTALNKKIFNDINFYETEVSSRVYQVGHMATVLSHYESRDALDAPAYSEGINTFQLLNDGRRWCVIAVTWDSDKGGHAITALND
ncbi:hypothetical protein [Alteromonas gilva]|uniref:Nuclear transport factor 2 family protein n=1 Tax=Alteromonas gilva TaxID=2987522 RepID=A0ABT5L8X3_9ALTE|nr:hypothetical protein [Alteromonas gilva]MDC8832447.1 hypothetical protein [Alteromonas gilva]